LTSGATLSAGRANPCVVLRVHQGFPDVIRLTALVSALQVPDNQFYFFQFPKPFPKFLPTPLPTSEPAPVSSTPMDVDAPAASTGKKGVSFAADVKMESSAAESKPVLSAAGGSKKAEIRRPEGQIGELVTTKKGRVKMRLGNGILYDVRLSPSRSAWRSTGTHA